MQLEVRLISESEEAFRYSHRNKKIRVLILLKAIFHKFQFACKYILFIYIYQHLN